jgi:hypothetical protein
MGVQEPGLEGTLENATVVMSTMSERKDGVDADRVADPGALKLSDKSFGQRENVIEGVLALPEQAMANVGHDTKSGSLALVACIGEELGAA